MRRLWLVLAALNGLAAVAIGAAAQHLWAADPHRIAFAQTGVRYGLPHAAALLALAALPAPARSIARGLLGAAGSCFALGATLFSGSLYAAAAGAPSAVTALTPVGGSLMILGWGLLLAYGAALGRER